MPSQRQIVPQRQLKQLKILKRRRKKRPVGVGVQVGDVHAVQQDPPLRRRIQPGQQLDQRGLSRAVLPDQHQTHARLQHQTDLPQRPLLLPRIAKGYALKRDAMRPLRYGQALSPAQTRRDLQILVQRVVIRVVCTDLRDALQRAVHAGRKRRHGAQLHGERARREQPPPRTYRKRCADRGALYEIRCRTDESRAHIRPVRLPDGAHRTAHKPPLARQQPRACAAHPDLLCTPRVLEQPAKVRRPPLIPRHLHGQLHRPALGARLREIRGPGHADQQRQHQRLHRRQYRRISRQRNALPHDVQRAV